jgi:proteasome lid subunit RPN8/RPN11
MKLTKKIKEKIKEHALKEAPHECCGLIVSSDKNVNVVPCNNASSSPEHHFKIPPFDYVRACNSGKLEAIYHSHPDGPAEFSLADQQNYNATKERFILYSVKDDRFCDSLEEENCDLLGRSFELGITDCMNIARDYYVSKFGIKAEYDEIWPSNGYYLKKNGEVNIKKVIERIKYFNFSLIKDKSPKQHDLLVLKATGPKDIWPCHLSIHVGHDKVLMQTSKRKSGLVDYKPVVEKNLLMIFRPNFI